MSKKEHAAVLLGVTVVAGALLQLKANQEATLLGFTTLELTLLGVVTGSLVNRFIRQP